MGIQVMKVTLLNIYDRLFTSYGPQHWWPADSPFEVIIGAILTQSTNWGNVEKAITNLKERDVLSPYALRQISAEELAQLVYPSGYYNAKAAKIKAFVNWLRENWDDDLDRLFTQDIHQMRQGLLGVHGIGEETADSIILYAARKPIFVIDAYTRRIISRLSLAPAVDSYRAFQELFMKNLPADERLFNEYHALLVCHGKDYCKKRPLCEGCCLASLCSISKSIQNS